MLSAISKFRRRRKLRRKAGPIVEPAARIVQDLCQRGAMFIDIGAFQGLYCFAALNATSRIVAFEPMPDDAAMLRHTFGDLIEIHEIAISDRDGAAVLHIPYLADQRFVGRASLDRDVISNAERDEQEQIARVLTASTKTRTLDSFGFTDVGLIKIDVEGHEMAVLAGAREMIAANRPNLIVEAEDRHKPGAVAALRSFAEDMGYDVYFLADGKAVSMNQFDPVIHQNMENLIRPGQTWGSQHDLYINNFILMTHLDDGRHLSSGP